MPEREISNRTRTIPTNVTKTLDCMLGYKYIFEEKGCHRERTHSVSTMTCFQAHHARASSFVLPLTLPCLVRIAGPSSPSCSTSCTSRLIAYFLLHSDTDVYYYDAARLGCPRSTILFVFYLVSSARRIFLVVSTIHILPINTPASDIFRNQRHPTLQITVPQVKLVKLKLAVQHHRSLGGTPLS